MAEINQDDFVFDRAPETEVIWIKHPETGGTAQLSMAAWTSGVWAGKGWEAMDEPPPEVDPTRAHMAAAAAAARAAAARAAAAAAAADEQASTSDAKTTKKSGTAGTTQKEGE